MIKKQMILLLVAITAFTSETLLEARGAGRITLQGFTDGLKSAANQHIIRTNETPSQRTKRQAKELGKTVQNGLTKGATQLADTTASVAATVHTGLQNAADGAKSGIGKVIKHISDKAGKAWEGIKGTARGLSHWIRKKVGLETLEEALIHAKTPEEIIKAQKAIDVKIRNLSGTENSPKRIELRKLLKANEDKIGKAEVALTVRETYNTINSSAASNTTISTALADGAKINNTTDLVTTTARAKARANVEHIKLERLKKMGQKDANGTDIDTAINTARRAHEAAKEAHEAATEAATESGDYDAREGASGEGGY